MAETLRVIGRDVSARTDLDDLLARVAQHALDLPEADYVAVVAVNAGGVVRVQASGNRQPVLHQQDGWEHASAAPGTPAADETIDVGEPLLVADLASARGGPLANDPIHQAEGGRSVLVVPLGHPGKIAGSLMLAFRARRSIGEDLIATAEALASHYSSGARRPAILAIEAATLALSGVMVLP